jgi:hypothetical protein
MWQHLATLGMPATPVNSTVPIPLDTAAIRAALDSPNPAVALAVALVAFCALTSSERSQLRLTDIVNGRVVLDERDIPLADPFRIRITTWLDNRARTWPGSINPHLLINRRSAPRLIAVGAQFPFRNLAVKPQALREDRILREIHATGGDARRVYELSDLTIEAAMRYAST